MLKERVSWRICIYFVCFVVCVSFFSLSTYTSSYSRAFFLLIIAHIVCLVHLILECCVFRCESASFFFYSSFAVRLTQFLHASFFSVSLHTIERLDHLRLFYELVNII